MKVTTSVPSEPTISILDMTLEEANIVRSLLSYTGSLPTDDLFHALCDELDEAEVEDLNIVDGSGRTPFGLSPRS